MDLAIAGITRETFAVGMVGFFLRDVIEGALWLSAQRHLSKPPNNPQEIPFYVEYRPTRCLPTVLPPNAVVNNENVVSTFSGVMSAPSWIGVLISSFTLLLMVVAYDRWIGKTTDRAAQVKQPIKKVVYHSGNVLAIIAKLQAQVNDLKSQVTRQKDRTSTAINQVGELQTQIDKDRRDAARRISQLENEAKQLKSKSQGLKDSLDSETKRSRQANDDAKSIQAKLTAAGKEIEALTSQLETAQKDVEKHKKALDPVTQQLNSARSQVVTLEHDKDVLSKDSKSLQTSLRDAKNAKASAEEAANKLRDQLEAANRRAASFDGENKKLRSTLDQLKAHRDAEKGLKEQVVKEIATLKGSLESKDNDLQQYEKKLGALYDETKAFANSKESEIDTLRRQNDSLCSQLRKACKRKQLDGSNGSNDDGGDKNDDSESGDEPGASKDDKTDDGRSPQPSNSSTHHESAAPKGNGSGTKKMQQQGNSDDGLSSSNPVHNETDTTKSQQEEDLDDGLSSSGPSPANGAGSALTTNNGDASDLSVVGVLPTQTSCPLGRPHVRCTTIFIAPPGYDEMTRGKQRREQAKFKKYRESMQCAFAAFAWLHPGSPVPARSLQYILQPDP